MTDLIISTLTQGIIYGILVYGVYIAYKILDFPDLTVDGSFPLGAAVTALLMNHGVNAFLTLPISAAAGALAGLVTGIIHVKLKVRDLIAGIITMTALFSINLQIGGSNLPVSRDIDTIFQIFPLGDTKLLYRKLIVCVIIALVVKILLDLYFKTKNGMLLKATGDNASFVTTLAKDGGTMKIIGLSLANALVALSGSIVCQEQRSFNSMMGTGQVVFGLAAVLIGIAIFKKMSFAKGTTIALFGSIAYKACIQVAIQVHLPANLLKLASAILFLVILIFGMDRKKGGVKS